MQQPTQVKEATTQVKVNVQVPGNHAMVSLLGTRDELLKLIEAAFESTVFVRGNEITIAGEREDAERVARLFQELISLLDRGSPLTAETVGRSIDMVRDGSGERPSTVFGDAVITVRGGRSITPKTTGQKRYVDAIRNNTIVFGIGPAGTGKTYLAMAVAVQALLSKRTNRLILTRPAVEAGEKLGFLPGTLSEKIDPYLRPLYDALYEMMDADQIARFMERGTIEVAPLGYMRGRTLNDSFIVLDEAQNTTPEQMKMFLTRLGFNSKAVVTGDITQIDLPTGQHSGMNVGRSCTCPRGTWSDTASCRTSSRPTAATTRPGRSGRFRASQSAGASSAPQTSPGGRAGVSVFVANEQVDQPVDEEALARLAKLAMEGEGVEESEISILLVDRNVMTQLNSRYMGEERPTDVLAFPIDGPSPASGPPDGPVGPRGFAGASYGDAADDELDDEEDEEDDDAPWLLGDIVLCPSYAAEQARREGQSLDAELELLTVHGVLHLCGFDHADPEEEREMRARTEELLSRWRSETRQ